MRPFRLIELVTGAALSVSVAPFAGQPVLADSIETVPIEAWNGDSVCRADDTATGLKPSAMSEGGCPEHAPETDEMARARAYLIETATPGYTMTRQGPERAIGRLHPEFVRRLAAVIAEARGAGLPFAGIFSAYRPPAFGIGGFADKFHSLHTYGLAVDVTGIGAPGTASALLWHEIAARHGVICPYGPYNLVEFAASGTVSASTADPPAHFFKQSQARTAMSLDPGTKTANNRTTPKTALSGLDSYAMRWPPLLAGKVGWPKGVPRIAKLDDETRRPGSRAANRTLSQPSLISIPPVLAEYSVGRGVIPSAHKNVERLRQARSNTKVPISAELAKICRALAIKAHATQRAGSGTASAQAQRDYFQGCVAIRSQKLA
jgi:hypothetical protein